MSNWPSLALEAAFGYVWTDTTPVWTDITDYLKSMSITRGRQRSLDQMQAGTAKFVLTNTDRRFEPGYSSSPYYDDVKVGVPVRLCATWSGTTYEVFYGYARSWRQVYAELGHVNECHLDCVDVFGTLAAYQLTRYPVLIADTTGLVSYWRLQETAGTTAADSATTASSGQNPGVYTGTPTLGEDGPLAGANYSVLFGSTRWVDVGAPSTVVPFDATTDWTWSAWIYAT